MQRLEPATLASSLSALPGWNEHDGVIEKTFRFDDYYRVMAFVNAVAFVAHAADHHPDLEVGYDRVRVKYTTHDAGGLTELDLGCAREVERLLATKP